MQFILDENIIIGAQTGRDDGGRETDNYAGILTRILDGGHGVAVTAAIWAKYSRQVRTLSGGPATPQGVNVMSILSRILTDAGREALVLPEPPMVSAIAGHQGIDQGDQVFVELACHIDAGIHLVTTDSNLIAALGRLDLPAQRGFEVQRPEDVLRTLGGRRP